MRLQSKLTLFSAVSKIVVVLLLIAILPPLIHRVALLNTDKRLNEKKDSVLGIVSEQGIESFIAEGSEGAYGSYNLLKEEFISIEQIAEPIAIDTIENSLQILQGVLSTLAVSTSWIRRQAPADDSMHRFTLSI